MADATNNAKRQSLFPARHLALLAAARQYRMEVLPTGDEDERSAADELDAAIAAYDEFCPLHGGYDSDQRGRGCCPYCVADVGCSGAFCLNHAGLGAKSRTSARGFGRAEFFTDRCHILIEVSRDTYVGCALKIGHVGPHQPPKPTKQVATWGR